MKTHLSHILPVWRACAILGEPTVTRVVSSLLLHLHKNKDEDELEDELESLTRALFYRHPPPDYKDTPLPPTVAQVWKQWMAAPLSLDKPTLLQFLVPTSAQPHTGPSGHMGLFDCWIYALQGHSTSSSSTTTSSSTTSYYGGGGGTSSSTTAIWIPDVLILFAICKQYSDLSKGTITEDVMMEKEEKKEKKTKKKKKSLDKKIIEEKTTDTSSEREDDGDSKSEISLREDSERGGDKEDGGGGGGDDEEEDTNVNKSSITYTMALLAYRIYDSYQKKGTIARDTIHRFLTDVHGEDSYKETEVRDLLDVIFDDKEHEPGWLHATVTEQQFCRRIMKTVQPGKPHVLLDWMSILACNMLPNEEIPSSVAAYLETMDRRPISLCDMYALANHRLYEIKRRFHSLVQSSSPVIQGDPMMSSPESLEESQLPKSSITEAAFVDAVSKPNDEMGHGGFLPPKLASLVFRAACHGIDDETKLRWTLHDVLQFGCMAVRRDTSQQEEPNAPLLRFLFRIFQMTGDKEDVDDGVDKDFLTHEQVTKMLLLLGEFADFRRRADASVSPEDIDDSEGPSVVTSSSIDNALFEIEAASLLGLLPPELDDGSFVEDTSHYDSPRAMVRLEKLVNYVLEGTNTPGEMSFEEFCKWERASPKDGPPSRLDLLMLELRLIAAVLFGIPPLEASMEVRIIGEIEGRHKERYTQTESSRRGPRGTIWYLIDSSWLKEWASVIKKVSKSVENMSDGRGDPKNDKVRGLGPISNTKLLAEDGTLALLPEIRWKHDYEILPPLGWSALQAWYDGGPPVYRSVVRYVSAGSSPHSPQSTSRSRIPTENELELYPFFVSVYLCDAVSRGEARPFQQNFQVSRVSPVLAVLLQLCKGLDIDPDMARLWVVESNTQSSARQVAATPTKAEMNEDWILNLEQNLVEQRRQRGFPSEPPKEGIRLLLELKDKETGLWPRGPDGNEWTFREKSASEPIASDLGDGIVGLYNMGNTCYLNSSIQCLSHTPIFREYFTSKAYLRDINTTNPLGHQGQLAQVSAVLINSLWKRFNASNPHQMKRVNAPGSYALVTAPSVTPKTFKESLAKFNDHFSGNEQHDAQELLAFLLGGLSEDLNRIVDKPYVQAPDSDGRPDHELADIWWSNHLKRELSVIVALFTGQFKSLLTCRSCGYESARFEPFTFIQLPLPEDDHLSVSLILYPLKDGSETLRYCVRVRHDGRLRDVLVALAKLLEAEKASDEGSQSPMLADKEEKDGEKGKLDPAVSRRVQNLAVVDMRDGYISKIAPNSWLLQDLQNKDTGDLPTLHIYELEPLSEESQAAVAQSKKKVNDENKEESDADTAVDSVDDAKEKKAKAKHGFLAVAQRRSEVTSPDFLHPFAHRIFGTPLLLRVDHLNKCTGRQLYDLVAQRMRNFVSRGAQRFLVGSKTENGSNNEAGSETKGTTAEERIRNPGTHRTTTDMEEVSAGPVPRYGFRLRLTTRDGKRCLVCPWYECCIGCLIPDDDAPTSVIDGDSIVVDWHFAVDLATSGFGTRAAPKDPFSSQLPPATKARASTVSVKNHSSYGSGNKKRGQGGITLEDCLDAFAKEERIPEAYCSKCKDFRVQTKHMSLWRTPPIVIIHLKRFQFTQHMRRKLRDLVVFPVEGLDLSRIMAKDSQSAPKENGTNDEGIGEPSKADGIKDNGRDEQLYDLYGVVHHQGALSGGHYVASLKSELDGQWRLFNDAQVFEIHARDVVDSSAYILFYIRRDVAKAKLSDYWEIRAEGEGVNEEEMNRLLKQHKEKCVIS